MDIWHRVSFNASTKPDFLEAIQDLGIINKTLELPGGGGMMVFIDIMESDPHWTIISELVATRGAVNMVETIFTNEEIRNAEWLRLISTFEQGYPQPKPHWPIKQLSYDIVCPKCAIYKQTHPMRLAKEPHLGRKSFMSLIWAAEIFCTPEVILGLESIQARGYEVWPALIHKTGKPSERVRQLYVPGIASPGVIIDDDLERKICPVCGTTKYYPHVKGLMYLKREALLPHVDFLLTYEWFGHGLLAWREILVSNRIASLILDKGWSGVRFKVVEMV
jgi:rubredoxin